MWVCVRLPPSTKIRMIACADVEAALALANFMVEKRLIGAKTDAADEDTLDFSAFCNNWGQTPLDLAIERGHRCACDAE